MNVPSSLFKYRTFDVNSLRQLHECEVYYANPRLFNDPLDCDPTLNVDIDRENLEELCLKLLRQSETEERARARISHHRYLTTQFGDYKKDAKVDDYYVRMLASDVKQSLKDEYGKMGVFSLAENWNCPLMWSHYANNHQGFCIEYDSSNAEFNELAQVRYDLPRSIKTSEIANWKLHDCLSSKKAIFERYFLSKAPSWQYESEWRDISERNGVRNAPALIKSVYFGLRCDSAVRTSIVKLLSRDNVKFFDIYSKDDGFDLVSRQVDVEEIEARGMRTPAVFDFRDVVTDHFDDS